VYYYSSVSSRSATILVGRASTPAAGLQTRRLDGAFAACRYVGQTIVFCGLPACGAGAAIGMDSLARILVIL